VQQFVRQRRAPARRPRSMRQQVLPSAEAVLAHASRKRILPEDAKDALLRRNLITALHEPRTVTELRELLLLLLQEGLV